MFHSEAGKVLGKEAYARAHAWALQRARIAAGLRLPTPPTLFGPGDATGRHRRGGHTQRWTGLARRGSLTTRGGRLSLDGIDLIASMEPAMMELAGQARR